MPGRGGENNGVRRNLSNVKLCKASFPPLLPTPVPGSSILALVARKKLSKKDSLPVEKKMGGGSRRVGRYAPVLGDWKEKTKWRTGSWFSVESLSLVKHYKLSEREIKSRPCNKIYAWSSIFLQLSAGVYM